MSAGEPRPLAEWLRDAWADPAAGCPPPEAWLADEQAALGAAERERLRVHLAGCPACQSEQELAAAFDAGGGAAGEDVDRVVARLRGPGLREERAMARAGEGNAPPAPVVSLADRRPSRRATWLRLAAAAAVVLGLGLAFQTLYTPAPPAPPSAEVVRGGTIETLAPAGEVGEVPGALRWEGARGARAYRVRIETVTGEVLWQAEVEAETAGGDMTAGMGVPEDVRARMTRAVTYRWTVQALDAAGRILAESEPAAFRATPEPEPPAPAENDGDPQP